MKISIKLLTIIAACLAFLSSAYAQKSKAVMQSEINSNLPDQAAGSITPSVMRTTLGDMLNSYQQYAFVNAQTGTTYTIQASDYGQMVTTNNVGAVAITLPQAAGSFQYFNFTLLNLGAGVVTITPQGGSTINGAASFSLSQNQSGWIVSDGSNYQVARGAGSIPNPLTLALGGTSGNLTANAGGIVWSDASQMQILAGTATAGQLLQSGSSATPSWTTATFPAAVGATGSILRSNGTGWAATTLTMPNTAAIGTILNTVSANTFTPTSTPTLGASGTAGTLTLGNATSGLVTLGTVAGALGTPTLSLPAATDTLIGKATPDTLTNKTYNTSGAGNVFQVNSNTISSITGTGSTIALQNSPAFTTPNVGAATATSINGNFFPTSTYTLAGTAAKTLTFSNSLTLAGTDNTTWTGPSTNATLAALNIADQTLSGGANVTAQSQSTGNIAVDCGSRPIQTITNGGAFTITAPTNDGFCLLKTTNNGSAGSITFSGFNVGSNTGDALSTANTYKFIISIIRAGGDSTYSIKALQ